MNEKKYDQSLNISTIGIREWRKRKEADDYNRYEATPYKALDKLFKKYSFNKHDNLIDFGCGRGRVSFYIHNRFQIPVTGIEANDKTFEEALDNEVSYRRVSEHITAPIQFDYGLAEDFEIATTANCFYFFNPFSVDIFERVVNNIILSLKKKERSVDIILYYPLPAYKRFLKDKTPFKLINKIKVPGIHGRYGKFLIYRI